MPLQCMNSDMLSDSLMNRIDQMRLIGVRIRLKEAMEIGW